ncbi:MAG TPA: hypothetical protein VN711_03345 [Candidatus Saccharimonadales bacterium]|nr:hypothetical protein [Candidatus Saccharimonadales bacterium]
MAKGEEFREKAGGVWQIVKGNSFIGYGGAATAIGAVMAPDEVKGETMDILTIFDKWSGTWGKQIPPTQHPVRDQIFATGHDFFHNLIQDGFTSVAGVLLFTGGIAAIISGATLQTIGNLRIKSS